MMHYCTATATATATDLSPEVPMSTSASRVPQAPHVLHASHSTHVFHRHLQVDYPVAVAGEGPYLIDSTGKRYFDGSGGAAVSCLGHNHPAINGG